MSEMTHKEFASKGGKATLKKHGRDHFRDLGRMSGEILKLKYGPDYFKNIRKGIKPSTMSPEEIKERMEVAEALKD